MYPGLPKRLQVFVSVVALLGLAWLTYLSQGTDWGPSSLGEAGLFVLLIVVAGSFPLPVAPRTTADVTTAVFFGAALVLEPGMAVLAATVGKAASNLLVRFAGDRLRLPGYRFPFHKYPFNLGETALTVGFASFLFHTMVPGEGLLTGSVAAAAAVMYLVNTALVSVAVYLEVGMNPLRIWWMGTKSNGLAELSLFAFGFLGAVVYLQSIWTVVALFIPVAVIYIAFSQLARANDQLEEALAKLEALQGRIVSNSKLASIGAISLDLAHQIKNPLAILLGRLEGIQDHLEEASRGRRLLNVALDAGWRINELTQNFMSIGRHESVEMDMVELLQEALATAGLRHQKKVDVRWECPSGLPKTEGNPVLVREALTNVFSNALEAVEEGGLISVAASRVDGNLVARVSDNGPGIPEKLMAHLFEPFHTNKPRGQGLGLFAAKHILEMHGGSIEVESKEGEGTCVAMRLPARMSQGNERTTDQEERNDTRPGAR